jgi:hypothetical protein
MESHGRKTCIVIDYGDGDSKTTTDLEFWGNFHTCKGQFGSLTNNQVSPIETATSRIQTEHIYM